METLRIEDLCRSIKENGWQPVDAMFVRKLDGAEERYVVLEGNRRLAAIVKLLDDQDLDKDLRARIREIEVLGGLDDGQEERRHQRPDYLSTWSKASRVFKTVVCFRRGREHLPALQGACSHQR